MPITFSCPCGVSYTVNEQLVGKQAHCPKCGRYLIIPSETGPANEVTPPPQGQQPTQQPAQPETAPPQPEEEEPLVAQIVPEDELGQPTGAEQPAAEPSTESPMQPEQPVADIQPPPPVEEPSDNAGQAPSNEPSHSGATEQPHPQAIEAEPPYEPPPMEPAPEPVGQQQYGYSETPTLIGVEAGDEEPATGPVAYEVKSFNVLQLSLFVAGVHFVLSFVGAIVAVIVNAITGNGFGAWALLFSLVGLIAGFVMGALGGIIYNLYARYLGGVQVSLWRVDNRNR